MEFGLWRSYENYIQLIGTTSVPNTRISSSVYPRRLGHGIHRFNHYAIWSRRRRTVFSLSRYPPGEHEFDPKARNEKETRTGIERATASEICGGSGGRGSHDGQSGTLRFRLSRLEVRPSL